MPNFAALRAAVFLLSTKNLRGGGYPPPVGARVNPRPVGGGDILPPPVVFLKYQENGGA